jgi:glutaredoxin-related protein
VKEVNSNFFYSALGIIIAICIVFNIIAVITAVEVSANLDLYRSWPFVSTKMINGHLQGLM